MADDMATAIASAVVRVGGGHADYPSPQVVVSAFLESLWSLYSNIDAVSGGNGSVQAASMTPRA